MKHTLTKTLTIKCELSSSEAIMFTKGGRHSLKLETKTYDADEGDYDRLNLDCYDFIEISFQIGRDEQNTFDSVTIDAMKHRGMWDEINSQSKEEAKKRMAAYAEQMESLKPKPPISEESSFSAQIKE